MILISLFCSIMTNHIVSIHFCPSNIMSSYQHVTILSNSKDKGDDNKFIEFENTLKSLEDSQLLVIYCQDSAYRKVIHQYIEDNFPYLGQTSLLLKCFDNDTITSWELRPLDFERTYFDIQCNNSIVIGQDVYYQRPLHAIGENNTKDKGTVGEGSCIWKCGSVSNEIEKVCSSITIYVIDTKDVELFSNENILTCEDQKDIRKKQRLLAAAVEHILNKG